MVLDTLPPSFAASVSSNIGSSNIGSSNLGSHTANGFTLSSPTFGPVESLLLRTELNQPNVNDSTKLALFKSLKLQKLQKEASGERTTKQTLQKTAHQIMELQEQDNQSVKRMMERLEVYYARMCSVELLSLSQVVQVSMRNIKNNALRTSFRQFLRSLPIEHAPMEHRKKNLHSASSAMDAQHEVTSRLTAYQRVREYLGALIIQENQENQENQVDQVDQVDKVEQVLVRGIRSTVEDEAIGHLMIAAIPWSECIDKENVNHLKSEETIDPMQNDAKTLALQKRLEENASRAWRSHSGRACWLLELLLEKYTIDTKTRLINNKFIKLIVLALRTACSSGGTFKIEIIEHLCEICVKCALVVIIVKIIFVR